MRQRNVAAAKLVRIAPARPTCTSRIDDAGFARVAGLYARLIMVGRVGVEPTTSRLSGVRSNHLSYRPKTRAPSVAAKLRLMARCAALAERGRVRNSLRYFVSLNCVSSLMKGHEDGG